MSTAHDDTIMSLRCIIDALRGTIDAKDALIADLRDQLARYTHGRAVPQPGCSCPQCAPRRGRGGART